jgi:solute carrier family 25 protein 34/35
MQGELGAGPRMYKHVGQALTSIVKDEGMKQLYRGFSAAIGFQVVMNGIRLSLYPAFKDYTNGSFSQNLVAGMTAGGIGAFFGSPFFLVKTRQQVQNQSAKSEKVGYQHKNITSLSSGLRSAMREGGGIRGLFRGANAQIARVCIGGGIQVSTYDVFKPAVAKHTGLTSTPLHVSASALAGVVRICNHAIVCRNLQIRG